MTLGSLAETVGAELQGDASIAVTGVTHNSIEVEAGDIFLAFKGEKFHGAEFASDAIARGAVAVLTDTVGSTLISHPNVLVVTDARISGAELASIFYKRPINSMESIGITGTNGKTTVTTLIHQIMTAVGRESGLIGTVETRIGTEVIASKRTTPESAELQALAASMAERHMRHCIMEVSSHSLDLHRLVGSHFAAVGFTNLTQDHLDFHHDMESYFKAKAALFTPEYADYGFINVDSEYGARLAEECPIEVISISRLNKKSIWHYDRIDWTAHGAEISIRGRDGVLIQTSTRLHGAFNLDNLLMAVAIASHCGIDSLQLAAVIPSLSGAEGRLEEVPGDYDFKVFIDYAHSPDAVTSVLETVRDFTEGRVIAVLGCGGDRDRSKRAIMGAALSEGSDVAIFTSDNPRSEDPQAILADMVGTLSIETPSIVESDRSTAIAYAISQARSGDCVVILGKGHETGQEIQGVVHPFSDRDEAIKALRRAR